MGLRQPDVSIATDPQRFPDDAKPLERRLAEQFMYVYNKWKRDGEPSDDLAEHHSEDDDMEPDHDDNH